VRGEGYARGIVVARNWDVINIKGDHGEDAICLKRCRRTGITYGQHTPTCFVDAKWGNDSETRRSRSCILFTLGKGTVSYKSRKLSCVAQSICEAESFSVADATEEPIHIRHLLSEIFGQVAAHDFELSGLDIDTAFLYASIKEDVYIRQPLGFDDGTSNVCHM
jgi:hypothetical protein